MNLGSDNVTYYEVDKKTGTGFKLKGEPINIGKNKDFRGFYFENEDFFYGLILNQSGEGLNIINKKLDNETVVDDPFLRIDDYLNE
ncbi:hypothetical protein GKC56_00745 [Neisseriaceae bacterium PsAf]|nr:hypothetical protein [Neisseriaceae bacterium PsAf]MCV2502953.1 hypothetical protein [Neisseriaceae bacterium]